MVTTDSLLTHTLDTSTNKWGTIRFDSNKAKADWLLDFMPLPGEYGFDKRVLNFNAVSKRFDKDGVYTDFAPETSDFRDFWELEKSKCYGGVLIDGKFYISGDHYFYLNFLRIPDKVKKRYAFPRFQDLDVWAYVVTEYASLTNQMLAILKARQTGFTLKFLARLIKRCWFEEAFAGKFAAFDERYVKSGWDDILVPYRAFLHENTGWLREFELKDKALDWKQGYKEMTSEGWKLKGNLSSLKGLTTKEKPSSVVSGGVSECLYDEAGVSKNLLKTLEFLEPALKYGNIWTGNVWVLGAAGETTESADLKKLIYNPGSYGCMKFPNVWSGKPEEMVGMFVPYFYSYGDCIDEWGNSNIERAKAEYELVEAQKKKADFSSYALFKAQYPATIEDAFSAQNDNIFPVDIISPHYERVSQKYQPTCVALEYDVTRPTGIRHTFTNAKPLDVLQPKKGESRDSAICVHEFPPSKPDFGLYYIAVDPIKNVRTDDPRASLLSLHVYKAAHKIDSEFVEDSLVAWYSGRKDDPNDTFEVVKKMTMWYNARVAIENDQPSCVEWMLSNKMSAWMLKRSDLPLLKDLVPTSTIDTSEYGIRMGSGNNKIKDTIYSLIIDYCSEILGYETGLNGEQVPIYGVSRIMDKMLLEEMMSYKKGGNFDRLVSFGLALLVARANTNRGVVVIRRSNSNQQHTTETRPPRTIGSPFMIPETTTARNLYQRLNTQASGFSKKQIPERPNPKRIPSPFSR